MNPLHKLHFLLHHFAENNEAEQDALKKYYELLDRLHPEHCDWRWYYNPEKGKQEDLDDVSDKDEDDEMKAEARKIWFDVKDYLAKATKIVKKIISEEKRHSLDLNALAQEIDGITPEMD